ncbi:MAG: hypothetical protein ABR547_04760 [Halanaerobium sp.]
MHLIRLYLADTHKLDASEKSMELRILVSADDSPTAWELRVFLREKLIKFIQENYPESLPRSRVEFPEDK